MDEDILKYLEDVRMACEDVERILAEYEEQYNRENNTDSDCK